MFSTIAAVLTVAWLVLCLAVLVGLPLAIVTRLTIAAFRFALLDRAGQRHWLPARWHRLGWKRLARNLQLAAPDKHLGNNIDSVRAPKVNYPRAKFWPNSFGWIVNARLIPGVGLTEFEDAAEHLANKWGCCTKTLWVVAAVSTAPLTAGGSSQRPGRACLRRRCRPDRAAAQ